MWDMRCEDCGIEGDPNSLISIAKGSSESRFRCLDCFVSKGGTLTGEDLDIHWPAIVNRADEAMRHPLLLPELKKSVNHIYDSKNSDVYNALYNNPKYQPGFVYLIQSDRDWYKIGRTEILNERFKAIDIAVPMELTLIHAIRTDSAPLLERKFHAIWDHKRVKGEWFQLADVDVLWFISREEINFCQKRWLEQRLRASLKIIQRSEARIAEFERGVAALKEAEYSNG